MRRKLIVVVTIMLLAVLSISLVSQHTAHAEDIIPQLPNQNDEIQDRGGPLERTIAVLLQCPLNLIMKLMETGGFRPVDELVFGTGLTDEERDVRPWRSEQERSEVFNWFWVMTWVVLPLFAFVVASTAFKLLSAATNPNQRAEAVESIWRWGGALLIIFFAPALLYVMLWLSQLLTDGIAAGFNGIMSASGRTTDSWGGIDWAGVNVVTGSVLGTAIVKVAFGLTFIYMNALYIIRGLALTVMLVFTPFVALMWAVNKNVQAAGQWIGEMMSNAAMPVAHALVLCTILLLADPAVLQEGGALDGTWATLLVMMYALIPLSEAIRNSMVGLFNRWAGISEENIAQRAATGILGVGALFGVGKALGGAVRRPGVGVPLPRPDSSGPPPAPGPTPSPEPTRRPPQPPDRYAHPQEYADQITGQQQQAMRPREAARRRMRQAADTVARVGGSAEETFGRAAGGSIPGAPQTARLAAGITRKGLEYGIKGGYYAYEAAQRIRAGEGAGKVLQSYAGEVKARYSPRSGASLDGPRHR